MKNDPINSLHVPKWSYRDPLCKALSALKRLLHMKFVKIYKINWFGIQTTGFSSIPRQFGFHMLSEI